jgi:hypothetical protein
MAVGMYSTRLVNKYLVAGNAYNTIGDPYVDPKGAVRVSSSTMVVLQPIPQQDAAARAHCALTINCSYCPRDCAVRKPI